MRKSLQDIKRMIVADKTYPNLQPKELEPFYCYTKDGGHSLCTVIKNEVKPGAKLDDFEVPLPVKYIQSIGYDIKDGYLIADVPYNPNFGVDIRIIEKFIEL